MAEISIAGVVIDTEDIDLLVNYCPLATLDSVVRFDKELLQIIPIDHQERAYWQHRLESHQLALEIAERLWKDGVKLARRILIIKPTLSITGAIIKQASKPNTKTKYKGIEL